MATAMKRMLAGVVAVCCLATSALAGDDVTLKLKYVKGDVLKYRTTTVTDIAGKGPQGEMKIAQTMVMDSDMTVKDVAENGSATIEMNFSKIKMDVEAPGGKMGYDSDNKDKDASSPLAIMGAMIGKPITFELEPNGSVKSVKGAKELADAVGNPQMAQMVSEESLKQTMERSFKLFPAKPLKPGDTWTDESSQNMGGVTLKFTTDATFKGMTKVDDRELAEIGTSVKVVLGPMDIPGVKIDLTEGGGTGTTWFDAALGQMRKMESTSKMAMDVNVDQNGQKESSTQNVTTKITVELIDGPKR